MFSFCLLSTGLYYFLCLCFESAVKIERLGKQGKEREEEASGQKGFNKRRGEGGLSSSIPGVFP